MANQERVDMKSESNIIVEFFFSASGGRRAPTRGGFVLCYLRLFSCSLAVAAKCNGRSLLYAYDMQCNHVAAAVPEAARATH